MPYPLWISPFFIQRAIMLSFMLACSLHMTPFHQIDPNAHAQYPDEQQLTMLRSPSSKLCRTLTFIEFSQLSSQISYGFVASVLAGPKEITENTDVASSVTNSIAGLARNNGAKKKPVKKMALLPNGQGNGSGSTCCSTGTKAQSQLKTRNKNHIQNDRTGSPLFPVKRFTIPSKISRSNF